MPKIDINAPEIQAAVNRFANDMLMEEKDVLAAFSDLNDKELLSLADGGVAGINILGGGDSGTPSGIFGADEQPEIGAASADADKAPVAPATPSEEKKEEKKEEKAKVEEKPKEKEAGMSDEAAKSALKAIADSPDAEKSVKKEAEDLSAKIDEAKTALDKVMKEADQFSSKNAPKPAEGAAPAAPAA